MVVLLTELAGLSYMQSSYSKGEADGMYPNKWKLGSIIWI
jgi:hypothetical protein